MEFTLENEDYKRFIKMNKQEVINFIQKEVLSDGLIKDYSKTDITLKMLMKQFDDNKKDFINLSENYEALKEKVKIFIEQEVELDKKKELDIEQDVEQKVTKLPEEKPRTVEDVEKDKEGKNHNKEIDKDDANKEKEITDDLKKMEQMVEEIEAVSMINTMESCENAKISNMNTSKNASILLDARVEYETALDRYIMRAARYIVEKNALTQKRDLIVLEISHALKIHDDEKVQSLNEDLAYMDNKVNGLDQIIENDLKGYQRALDNAYNNLQNTSKEVSSTVKADFKNMYSKKMLYNEEGILKGESTTVTGKLHKDKQACCVTLMTKYDENNVVSNGKFSSIMEQKINIEGKTIRVITNEFSTGVDVSALNNNKEQVSTGVGDKKYVMRDKDGDLVTDSPELSDSLNKIGLENVNDIEDACEAIDEKSKNKDEINEKQNEDFEVTPSTNTYTTE